MAQSLDKAAATFPPLAKDSESDSAEVSRFESSPSLRALAKYIKETSEWDPSLLKKEVA